MKKSSILAKLKSIKEAEEAGEFDECSDAYKEWLVIASLLDYINDSNVREAVAEICL